MRGLRNHVAEAIRVMQEQGGVGILRAEECAALHEAAWALEQKRHDIGEMPADDIREERLVLAGIAADLGPHPIFMHGQPRRIDAYWLKCADVAIAAYDDWLEQRTKEKNHG